MNDEQLANLNSRIQACFRVIPAGKARQAFDDLVSWLDDNIEAK